MGMDATQAPQSFDRPVSIIGAGRLGQAVGTLLREAGIEVKAVSSHSLEAAQATALTSGGMATTDHIEAARRGSFVLVALPDDVLADVVGRVAAGGGFAASQVIAHTSPSLGLDALSPAAEAGAAVGCMTPIQRFATAEQAVREMRGAVFALTADERACPVIESLVTTLGGTPVRVSSSSRRLVDAAMAVASQDVLMVWDAASELLVQAGFTRSEAKAAIVPLVRNMGNIVRQFGTRGAVGGPIAHGDAQAVRAHLATLEEADPAVASVYRALGRRAVDIARTSGDIDEETAEELRRLLAEGRSA